MGADFIVDYTYWKAKKGESPQDGFNRHVESIEKNIGKLKAVPATMEDALGEMPKCLGELQDILSERLEEIVLAASTERTATFIQMGQYTGLITGGSSWGDSPSDAYDALGVLHAAGVIDLPK